MRKIKQISALITLIVLGTYFYGCEDDFLDLTPQDKLNSSDVWEDSNLIELVINELYQSMPDGFNRGWCMLDSATDNGENSYEWPPSEEFNRGDYTTSNYPLSNSWPNDFAMIRQANLFFDNIDKAVDLDADTKNRMIGEVHFLRGFYYFDLLQQYGGVPIIEKALSLDDNFDIPRSSADEVAAFIMEDFNVAETLLPVNYNGTKNIGKATRYAAIAYKGRLLSFTERWAESAATNKQIIDSGEYSLFPDYQTLFFEANDNNGEVIFDKQFQDPDFGHFAELFNQPIGFGGWGGTSATQDLVDAYEMTDGLPYDQSPLYDENNPYDNKDPRFEASIMHNGTMWRGRAIETFVGGLEGINLNGDATETGYKMKKFLNQNFEEWVNLSSGSNWIYVRYAEILLNYAEAQNEASGPDASVYAAVNEVRARPSVNMPPIPIGLTKDQMREKIRHERRVELAFEEHRFWDVRRWHIAEDIFSRPIHGFRIGPNGETTGTNADGLPFGRFQVENRRWDAKNNLAPIPQSEIDKQPGLTQNPGY